MDYKDHFMERRVRTAWGETGTVEKWEPLLAGMCDALVVLDDGRSCWYSSSDLRAAESGALLPQRRDEQERARLRAVSQLQAIRAQHVAEFAKPWPGAEFAKVLVGRAIDGALRDLGLPPRTDT